MLNRCWFFQANWWINNFKRTYSIDNMQIH